MLSPQDHQPQRLSADRVYQAIQRLEVHPGTDPARGRTVLYFAMPNLEVQVHSSAEQQVLRVLGLVRTTVDAQADPAEYAAVRQLVAEINQQEVLPKATLQRLGTDTESDAPAQEFVVFAAALPTDVGVSNVQLDSFLRTVLNYFAAATARLSMVAPRLTPEEID